jgi:hypothetical protein
MDWVTWRCCWERSDMALEFLGSAATFLAAEMASRAAIMTSLPPLSSFCLTSSSAADAMAVLMATTSCGTTLATTCVTAPTFSGSFLATELILPMPPTSSRVCLVSSSPACA